MLDHGEKLCDRLEQIITRTYTIEKTLKDITTSIITPAVNNSSNLSNNQFYETTKQQSNIQQNEISNKHDYQSEPFADTMQISPELKAKLQGVK